MFIQIFLTILAGKGNGSIWEAEGKNVCLLFPPLPSIVTDLFGTKPETLNQCSQQWNSSYCGRNTPFSLAYIVNCFLIYQVIIFLAPLVPYIIKCHAIQLLQLLLPFSEEH